MLRFLASFVAVTIASSPPPLPDNYVQTMLDEFNGTTLNATLWTAARTTHLNACYTPEAIEVSNGVLSITASDYGHNHSCADGNLRRYRSGLVNSTNKFAQRYGLFQARLHLLNNSAGGLHPTFWTIGQNSCWPSCGEIDIMEVEGSNYPPKHSYYTSSLHVGAPGCCNHTCELSDKAVVKANYGPVDLGDWHIWQVEWTPDALVFAMDGTVTGQVNTTDHMKLLTEPQLVIFGLAVMAGDQSPSSNTSLPYTVKADWIRIAQHRSRLGHSVESGKEIEPPSS
eukprot:m.76581 g.76581  ORF g.76581 m.76581 type:complete len:283 (-) comp14439_c0_seq1:210-1058(-)